MLAAAAAAALISGTTVHICGAAGGAAGGGKSPQIHAGAVSPIARAPSPCMVHRVAVASCRPAPACHATKEQHGRRRGGRWGGEGEIDIASHSVRQAPAVSRHRVDWRRRSARRRRTRLSSGGASPQPPRHRGRTPVIPGRLAPVGATHPPPGLLALVAASRSRQPYLLTALSEAAGAV